MNSLVHGFDENEKGSIQIRFRLDKGILVWTYEDDGKGIPADIIAKVFEPFFTTSRATGGSGLGLHIVYNTVTAIFGGHIALSSVPSQGVKFTITIPVRQEEIRYERTK